EPGGCGQPGRLPALHPRDLRGLLHRGDHHHLRVMNHPQSGWLHEGPPRGPGALLTDRARLGRAYGTPAMRPATGAARVSKRTVRLPVRVLYFAPWSECLRTRLRSPASRPAFHGYHRAPLLPFCGQALAHDGTAEPHGVTPPEAVASPCK